MVEKDPFTSISNSLDTTLYTEVYEDHAEVKSHMGKLELLMCDNLARDFFLTLPDKIHLDLEQNDFTELRNIWDIWGKVGQQVKFEEEYGAIAQLLHVDNIDNEMITGMLHFWDPSYRCFIFNGVDMTPTIEEYATLLELKVANPHKVYLRKSSGLKRKLAKIMGISVDEVHKYITYKNGNLCVPWIFLRDFIILHKDEVSGKKAFALAIYGMVVFPKTLGHVDSAVIDFFEQVDKGGINPIPSILAETFRSLSNCRTSGSGRFIGCAQLLYIWVRSHLFCPKELFKTIYHPIREFLNNECSERENKCKWISKLQSLEDNDFVWRAPWMNVVDLLYKCGNKLCVPLLGIWGITSYAPIMVLRQFGAEQFVPVTDELQAFDFTYGESGSIQKTKEIVVAWKKLYKVRFIEYTDKVTSRYLKWHIHLKKDVSTPLPLNHTPVSNPEPEIFNKTIQKVEEESFRPEDKNGTLHEEMERLRGVAEERAQHILRMEKDDAEERANLKRLNKSLQEQVDVLKAIVEDRAQKIQKIETEQNECKQTISITQEERQTAEEKVKRLLEENQQLLTQLKNQEDDLKVLQTKDQTHVDQCKKIETKNQFLTDELERFKKERKTLENAYWTLQLQVGYVMEEMGFAAKIAEEMKDEVKALREAVPSMETDKDSLHNFLEKSQNWCHQVSNLFGRIYNL